jgi:hypothetical protein
MSKKIAKRTNVKHTEKNVRNDQDKKLVPIKKPIQRKAKGWMGSQYGESIYFESKPAFLIYDSIMDEVRVVDMVETPDLIYYPLKKEDCGYRPYEFSGEEFEHLKSSKMTKENLLEEIEKQVDMYLSARKEVKFLTVGDILLTYCQEWIDTMHTPYYVGETESGKSSAAHLFRNLGYRPLYGANIPYANIYTFLGTDEEGAGTIIEDEAQGLDWDRNKLKLYKNSYARGQFESRVEMRPVRHQVHFRTFCFKVFAGESLPHDKGMNERLAVCHMIQGKVKKNIKRLSKDDEKEINILRNKLLLWKIQNVKTGLDKTETNLTQRDQELWEDYLRVMNGTKYEQVGTETAGYFIKQRHEKIWNSLDARIFKELCKNLEDNRLYFERFWHHLTGPDSEINGILEGSTYLEDETSKKITKNSLSKLLEEKFQGIKKATYEETENDTIRKRTYYVFKPEIIESLKQKYNTNEVKNEGSIVVS